MFPLLDSQFFRVNSPPAAFFQYWKEAFQWSENCLPLASWDQTLYVGITPGTTVPSPFPRVQDVEGIFFLVFVVEAEAEALQKLWLNFHPGMMTSENFEITAPPPVEKISEFFVPEPEAKPEIFSFPEEPLSPPISNENTPTLTLLEQIERTALLEATSIENLINQAGQNEVADFQQEAQSEEDSLPPLEDLQTHDENPSPVAELAAAEPMHEEQILTKPFIAPAEKVSVDHHVQSTPVKRLTGEAWNIAKKQFQYGLLFSVQESRATLLQSSANVRLDPMDLQNPSPFRIVCRTEKPFFGAVAPNDFNDGLFVCLTGGTYPALFVVIPIFTNETLTHLFAAYSFEKRDLESLRELEDLAPELLKSLAA